MGKSLINRERTTVCSPFRKGMQSGTCTELSLVSSLSVPKIPKLVLNHNATTITHCHANFRRMETLHRARGASTRLRQGRLQGSIAALPQVFQCAVPQFAELTIQEMLAPQDRQ